MDVTVIWAAIIALGLFMYVVLDGFDLGIGIVFPFFPAEQERDLMMNTVAPVWDGNETWLVLGGAGLFAVFPIVYSTVLSALYLPLVFMLVCLIFRGVSFEIRAKARRTKHLWDLAFIGGSTGATFFQGVALGAFLQGIPVDGGRFAGDAFGWLTPFSLLTGLGLIATYALLGCCWLVAKTEGDLQRRLHRVVWPLTVVLLGFIAVVSLWTPLQDTNIAQRWFATGLFWRLLPVPFLVAGCAVLMRRAVREPHHTPPFARPPPRDRRVAFRRRAPRDGPRAALPDARDRRGATVALPVPDRGGARLSGDGLRPARGVYGCVGRAGHAHHAHDARRHRARHASRPPLGGDRVDARSEARRSRADGGAENAGVLRRRARLAAPQPGAARAAGVVAMRQAIEATNVRASQARMVRMEGSSWLGAKRRRPSSARPHSGL